MGLIGSKYSCDERISELNRILDRQDRTIIEQKSQLDILSKKNCELHNEISGLRKTIEESSLKIDNNDNKDLSENIDKFIEKWYEKNKKEIDIGVIADLPIIGEIDILPDNIEKYIYKRCLQITFCALKDVNINFLGNNVSLDIKPTII